MPPFQAHIAEGAARRPYARPAIKGEVRANALRRNTRRAFPNPPLLSRDPAIQLFHPMLKLLFTKILPDTLAGGSCKLPRLCRVAQDCTQRIRKLSGRLRRHKQPGLLIRNDLTDAAHVRRDNRYAVRHRFQYYEGHSLAMRRKCERIDGRVEPRHIAFETG